MFHIALSPISSISVHYIFRLVTIYKASFKHGLPQHLRYLATSRYHPDQVCLCGIEHGNNIVMTHFIERSSEEAYR